MLAQMGRFDLVLSARAVLTPETEGDIEISQGLDRCANTSRYILIQGTQHSSSLTFLFKSAGKKEQKGVGKKEWLSK